MVLGGKCALSWGKDIKRRKKKKKELSCLEYTFLLGKLLIIFSLGIQFVTIWK